MTDQQEEERQIVDLENAIKRVSLKKKKKEVIALVVL